MAQIDWAAYAEESKGGGFALMPVGMHNVEVESAEVKDAKNNHFAILLRLVAIDGPAATQSILNNLSMFKNNGEPNGFFMSGLSALGIGTEQSPEFWASLQGMEEEQAMALIAQACLGRRATITVNHRVHGGENRDNVKKMVPIGAPMLGAPGAPGTVVPIAPGAPMPAAPVAAPVAPVVAAPAPAVPVAAPAVAVPQVAAPAAPAALAPAPVATEPQPVPAAPAAVAAPDPVIAAPAPVAPVAPAAVAPAPAPVAAPVAQVDPMQPPEGSPF